MTNSRKLILAKILNFFNSWKLIPAKCIFFWLAKISTPKVVNVDDMWFCFTPGRGTTDAIFILTEIQEKYIGKNRNLNFAFADPDLGQVAQKGPMVDFK